MVLPMAFATIDAVPNVEIRLKSTRRPSWNMPFSTPLGTPM
jgi:hypothetical protein